MCVPVRLMPRDVQVLSERDLLGGDSERGPAHVGNAEDEEAARAIDAGKQPPA